MDLTNLTLVASDGFFFSCKDREDRCIGKFMDSEVTFPGFILVPFTCVDFR